MSFRELAVALGLLTFASPPITADFDAGLAAYRNKNYTVAYREWFPIAEAGDAKAQYFLSLVYKKLHDEDRQGTYLCTAAEQGYKEALSAYTEFLADQAFYGDETFRASKLISANSWCSVLRKQVEKEGWECKSVAKQIIHIKGIDGLRAASATEHFGENWQPVKYDARVKANCAVESAATSAGIVEAHRLMGGQNGYKIARIPKPSPNGSSETQSIASPEPFSPPNSSDAKIRSEIEEIEKSGQYSQLPAPQRIPQPGAAAQDNLALYKVENGTPYTLRLLLSGPSDSALVLSSGESRTILLTPGTYKVAGRVSTGGVLPYFGTETYERGGYQSRFYIRQQ